MLLRFAHLADLHPDDGATLAGHLIRDPNSGLNTTLVELSQSLAAVVETATHPDTVCHFSVFAGDLHDTTKPTPNEKRVILDAVIRLAKQGPILLVPGNHDQPTNTVDASAIDYLRGIPNVIIFPEPGWQILTIHDQPIQVFALPYPARGQFLSSLTAKHLTPEAINAEMTNRLSHIIRKMHDAFLPGLPHLLIAHGTVKGSQVGVQPRSLTHDILISPDDLDPFDYAAFGHIHQAQQVGRTTFYPGSLTRQSIDEEAEDKGWNLVELEPYGAATVRFIPNTYARPYRTVRVADLATLTPETLDPSCVYRVKDEVDPETYEQLKPQLATLQAAHPLIAVAIDVRSATRVRDTEMSALLSSDDALLRDLTTQGVPTDEIPFLLDKHRLLEQTLFGKPAIASS